MKRLVVRVACVPLAQVDYWCLNSTLPSNYGRSWPNFTELYVQQYPNAKDDAQLDPGCGLVGPLPAAWGSQMPNLKVLDLSGNRLTGGLPGSFGKMTNIRHMSLQGNLLQFKIPSSWSELKNLTYLDLSSNKLSGNVPPSFSSLKSVLEYFFLSNNPQLQGCVPLEPRTTLTFTGTGISGLCANPVETEAAQTRALLSYLGQLLNKDGRLSDVIIYYFNKVLSDLPLGRWISPGQTHATWPMYGLEGDVIIRLQLIQGTVYVTQVTANQAGLDLTVLPNLVAGLPMLEAFTCHYCSHFSNRFNTVSMLPGSLAAEAPATMKKLTISDSKLWGPLPVEWANWKTIQELNFAGNSLSGDLPASWANMSALTELILTANSLSGNDVFRTPPLYWAQQKSGCLLYAIIQ
jgi:hypothetical protein